MVHDHDKNTSSRIHLANIKKKSNDIGYMATVKEGKCVVAGDVTWRLLTFIYPKPVVFHSWSFFI
jgi:hypothetical protein